MTSQRAPLPIRHGQYRQNLRLARAKWGDDLSRQTGVAHDVAGLKPRQIQSGDHLAVFFALAYVAETAFLAGSLLCSGV